jgi:hypothetical protein
MATWLPPGFVLLVLGLSLAALARPARADDLIDNAKARAAAAGEAYRLAWLRLVENVEPASSANLEVLHLWSHRGMEAEQDVSNNMEDKAAAAQAHLERMKKPEAFVKKLVDAGDPAKADSAAAKFYRLEAERQVLLAKAK